MPKFAARLAAALALCLAGFGLKAQVHSTEQIEVELVAETTTVVPGETLWLGIRLDPIENWHTYWKFGGDSGEATSTSDWQLPAGMAEDDIGEIVWPIPEWTPFLDSGLVTFTYGHEVYLPLPVAIPADFAAASFTAETTIDWQVCEVICIPGSARFSISLPVAEALEPDARWREGFAESRANTPVPLGAHDLAARFNRHDGKVNVMVAAPDARFADVDEAWFFPTRARVMQYAPYRDVMLEDSRIQISTEQHARHPSDMNELDGLLAWVDEEGALHGYELRPVLTSVAWDHSIEVELIAENDRIIPGETTWLGLRLNPAEHWHTYWKMGGDSGEPTSVGEWSAPPGTTIGELQFPAPHWLPFYDTDLVNFGYEEEVLHPVAVTLPADYQGDTVVLSTLAYWNVCELICIPGEQRLDINLPVGETAVASEDHAGRFASAREQLPQVDHDINAWLAAAGERISLGFETPSIRFDGFTDAWFFPEQRRVIKPGPLRDVSAQASLLQITHEQPRRMLENLDSVYGTLVLENAAGARSAYEFADSAQLASATTVMPMAAGLTGDGAAGGLGSLPLFMLGALLGGMILNLMPCVFPVLSLKALSFVAASGESARRQRNEGLAYTGGILVSFVVLASALIALRAAGEQVGWAFQFQQPWFLAFIVFLFFTLGLSLSGVFEVGTGLMGVGNNLTARKGYKGSFFTGVLATIVATPCTAPFMGPAIGFAPRPALAGGDAGLCCPRLRHGAADSGAFLVSRPDPLPAAPRRLDEYLQAVHGLPAICFGGVLPVGARQPGRRHGHVAGARDVHSAGAFGLALPATPCGGAGHAHRQLRRGDRHAAACRLSDADAFPANPRQPHRRTGAAGRCGIRALQQYPARRTARGRHAGIRQHDRRLVHHLPGQRAEQPRHRARAAVDGRQQYRLHEGRLDQ